jgi:hypothetical protein
VYVIFELSDTLPDMNDAAKFGRYVGSEINADTNKARRTSQMTGTYRVEVNFQHS